MKILCKYAKKMEALSKYHYQKNKRNVGPKERKKKTDGPTHGDVLYTPSTNETGPLPLCTFFGNGSEHVQFDF